MPKDIVLIPKKSNLRLFKYLEKLKLIKLFIPTLKTINTKTKTGAVSKFYSSDSKFGTHSLICVGKRTKDIIFSYHDDNEDFLLLNPLSLEFDKLFLIVSTLKKNKFLNKFHNGDLTNKDLIAIELEFNNPALSFFTMLKHTIHCEITENKNGQHPVFFVTESSKLKNNKLKSKLYNLSIKL
jgi:hypothetical protein